jgi:hypothetical protein
VSLPPMNEHPYAPHAPKVLYHGKSQNYKKTRRCESNRSTHFVPHSCNVPVKRSIMQSSVVTNTPSLVNIGAKAIHQLRNASLAAVLGCDH